MAARASKRVKHIVISRTPHITRRRTLLLCASLGVDIMGSIAHQASSARAHHSGMPTRVSIARGLQIALAKTPLFFFFFFLRKKRAHINALRCKQRARICSRGDRHLRA